MTDFPKIPYPLLVTDSSALGVRVGILGDSGWLAYVNHLGEVSAALFQAVEIVFADTNLSLGQMAGFAYCEGPGSTLGIRVNAMALRAWNSLFESPRPVFAYKSLEAAALMIYETQGLASDYAIFSDLRKGAWNACKVDPYGTVTTLEIVKETALKTWSTRRFFIQQRHYSPGAPPVTEILNYDLKPLGTTTTFRALLRPVEKATVYQSTKTEFKKWEPQRHR